MVARAGDDEVARLALPPSRTFALEYRHSYYRQPARETFRAAGDGSFSLVAVSSPSEAVLDYYEIDGARSRHDGWWTLRPARPAQFEGMALAATAVGRRTLVAGDAPGAAVRRARASGARGGGRLRWLSPMRRCSRSTSPRSPAAS